MSYKHIQAINDPLYGFIYPSSELICELISHPFFQRLRRIKQLGLVDYVYPGATHNRFQHALGAMHLGSRAVVILRKKGVNISDEEKEALEIALLLHDIGHSPFSHTLENMFFKDISHEHITQLMMQMLVNDFGSQLRLAISIFKNTYERGFFHQLVSSQIDVDRMDYLQRDSFYSGVADGNIGGAHLMNMFNVHQDELVLDEKGIYSVESFLSARRLMTWQVYMHKTAIAAEKMLVNIIKRVIFLVHNDSYQEYLSHFSEPLATLLGKSIQLSHSLTPKNRSLLKQFSMLDDSDIICGLKIWSRADDKVLATLAKDFLKRKFFRCQISLTPASHLQMDNINAFIRMKYKNVRLSDKDFFYSKGVLSHHAYNTEENGIKIITKEGVLKDIADISDLPNIKNMHTIVKKYYLCWPK